MAVGDYIGFRFISNSPSGKTKIFEITNIENGSYLGRISWYGAWRKYVFAPEATAIFEERCLRDIAEFCERETIAQRKAAKEAKASA